MTSLPKYVMEPPPGQVRTEINPPSNGTGIITTAIATTIIALIVVGLRVFTRGWVLRGAWGTDDYLVILSMILSIAFMGLSIKLTQLGCGLHMWDMLTTNYSPPYLVTTLGITFTYSTCVSSAKLSILVLYLRLSLERWFRRGVYFLIGLVCAYTVAYLVTIMLLCSPVSKNWDITVEGKCISRIVPMMVLSVANIVIDVAILLTPVKVVAPLQMPRRQKFSVLLLFVTGIFVIISATYRTYILPNLINAVDYTWENPDQNIWGSIEANAGIICASVPALKPLFRKYLPFLLGSSVRSKSHSQNYDNNPSHYAGSTLKNINGSKSGLGHDRKSKKSSSHKDNSSGIGLSSTMDRNSKRRYDQSHGASGKDTDSNGSFELSQWDKRPKIINMDDSSSESGMAGGPDDDERRLWSAAARPGNTKPTRSSCNDESRAHGATSPANVFAVPSSLSSDNRRRRGPQMSPSSPIEVSISAAGRPASVAGERLGSGAAPSINVTRETSITYERV